MYNSPELEIYTISKIYRTDNNLQGMRDKFFSNKGKNVKKTVSTKKKKKSQFSTKTNGKKAKRASKKVKNDATEKEAQEETKQMQEFSITPQEPKVSASEMVADVKKEERKHCGIEILDEVSTILSARRAKAVARKKFIRTDLIPTVDEKKDDKLPQFETFSETPKIRFKVKREKYFLVLYSLFGSYFLIFPLYTLGN